jgi:DNA-binding CsgD family transcriptional regulator
VSGSWVRPPREVLAWLAERLGLSDAAIAELCGVAPNTVRRWRKDDGIRRKVPVDREVLVDLYWSQGLSMAEVGVKLGRSKDAVRMLMRRYGVPARKRGRRRRSPDRTEIP